MLKFWKKNRHFFVIVISVLLLDQILKLAVKKYLQIGISIVLNRFISITFITNTGVSFGFFKGFNALFIIVAIIVLVFVWHLKTKNKKYIIQFGIISGGIIGNLIDRILYGYVIDFIDFGFFPIFNIADSAISLGTIWLILLLWKNNDNLN